MSTDSTLTWICDTEQGGCGIREVWDWAEGTVLCRPCAKRIAGERGKAPPQMSTFMERVKGMERGRIDTPIDDGRTELERMASFEGWRRYVAGQS